MEFVREVNASHESYESPEGNASHEGNARHDVGHMCARVTLAWRDIGVNEQFNFKHLFFCAFLCLHPCSRIMSDKVKRDGGKEVRGKFESVNERT